MTVLTNKFLCAKPRTDAENINDYKKKDGGHEGFFYEGT